MEYDTTRAVGLIVSRDPWLAADLVEELRALGWIAVAVDACGPALEMMEVVEFSVVIVDVAGGGDWLVSRRGLREMLRRLQQGERAIELVAAGSGGMTQRPGFR